MNWYMFESSYPSIYINQYLPTSTYNEDYENKKFKLNKV